MTTNSSNVDAASSEEPLPRPSVWLVLHSLISIGAALLFVAIAAATIVASWNPCDKIAAVLLGTPCILFVLAQYRGTFRRNATCALQAALCHTVIACFGMLIGPTYFVHHSMDVVWVAAVGVFCVIGVPLNFFWRDRLQRAAAQGVSLRSNYQFTLLELVVFTGIFGVTLAVAVDAIRHSHPQTAEHVAASYAPFRLPPGASDVSYHCRIRSGRWVEFTVDEPELIEWFEAGDLAFQDESLGVKLRESGLFLSVDRPGELSGPTSITIKNGLRAGWSEEGNGFKLYYDRDTKRAYYNVFFD